MLGAIAGDIIGSVHEFECGKSTDFPLFVERCNFTDDSVLTVAVAECLLTGANYPDKLREYTVAYQGTVPEAITASLESDDYESAIRLAISLGGDADTLACITGGIAAAFYGGVPKHIAEPAWALLDDKLRSVVSVFCKNYNIHHIPGQ
jgi:ADP-ribosylglycohydrolase